MVYGPTFFTEYFSHVWPEYDMLLQVPTKINTMFIPYGWNERIPEGQITRKKSLSHFSRRFLKILRKNLKNLKKIPNSKKISKITKIFKKISRDLNLCHFFSSFFAPRGYLLHLPIEPLVHRTQKLWCDRTPFLFLPNPRSFHDHRSLRLEGAGWRLCRTSQRHYTICNLVGHLWELEGQVWLLHKGRPTYPGEGGLEKPRISGHLWLFPMKLFCLNRTHGGRGVWKSRLLPDVIYGWAMKRYIFEYPNHGFI